MQNKSDAELMRLIKEKHRPALEELYDRYIKLVYSFAFKSTKDQEKTRVIVQAVFTREQWERIADDPANNPEDILSRKLLQEQVKKSVSVSIDVTLRQSS